MSGRSALTGLTAWIESALLSFYNDRHTRRQARGLRERAAAANGPPGAGDSVLLGHTLPWSPPADAGAFALRSPRPSRSGDADAGGGPDGVTLPLAARRRHLYAVGATGTGKTNLLMHLIEDDLRRGRALCVVDLRGDLVDRALTRVAALPGSPDEISRRLLLLDLREDRISVGFNPLAAGPDGGTGDSHARALFVLAVLRQSADSWGVQLDETLRNALLALAETDGSLLQLDPLLADAAYRARVLAAVTDPYVRAFFAGYDALSPDKQLQWRLPVLNKVSGFLAVPAVRRLLAGAAPGPAGGRTESPPPATLRTLLDRTPGAVILVSLAADRLHGAAHLIGGLFVSAFQNAILARADMPEGRRIPVHLYVDEFENLVGQDTARFEQMLAEGRRFGLGLALSHQNLAQMPEALGQMILNNAQTQFYFQTGATDAARLCREVIPHPGETPGQVARALTTQPVGTAYLLRRGAAEPTARIRMLPCPDPPVPGERVAAIRDAALRRHGRPAADVDREIARWVAGGGPVPDAALPVTAAAGSGPGSGATAVSAGAAGSDDAAGAPAAAALPAPSGQPPTAPSPAYVIRHAKAPGRFAPRKGAAAAPAAPPPEKEEAEDG